MKAGFAEADITPPVGTKKIGWLTDLTGELILSPLFARVAVFDDANTQLGFIQLDTLCIRWTTTNEIRKRIEAEYGFAGANIMVSATHNHAGPAVSNNDPVPRDDAYTAMVISRCVTAFGEAIASMQEVETGYARSLNFDVAHNRRTMMRDGTTRSQTPASNEDYLCLEGPIDPEVGVLAVRGVGGEILGALVNYACHPTHRGGTNEFCAGFPGIVCDLMKKSGCPVTLYLNGAFGNVIDSDYERKIHPDMHDTAERVFASAQEAMAKIEFQRRAVLSATKDTLRLPFRTITEDEYHGRVRGAQRYGSDELYENAIDKMKERIEREGMQKAEVQVLGLNEVYYAGIPAEYFVEYQLQIKMETYPANTMVVGGANGMIGYVPTRKAFLHGGYETTLGPPSRMAPETGDLLAEGAIRLIRSLQKEA